MIFLGLDAGSTGCKCVAFSEDGVQLSVCYTEYKTAAGASDMNADEMYSAIEHVIIGCVSRLGNKASDIVSIAVTSFGEACVPVDKNGKCLSKMIMYTDARGVAEADRLVKTVGLEQIMHTTCVAPAAMYSLPKIMWTLDNVPGVKENVHKFLQASDFICYRLSGESCVSETLACRTLAYDIERGCWSEEILNAAGVTSSIMPTPVKNGSIVGNILPSVAEKLGIPKAVKIIAGSQDQIAAATGAGVLASGQAVDGTGSVECITPVFDHIIRNSEFVSDNFVCVPHSVNGCFATYQFNFSGGVLLKWFRDTFAEGLKSEAASRGVSVYRILDESCPKTPSDILVIPHFMGAGGTPDMVPSAKGTISGMTMSTGINDIYRAIMEGLTFEMAYNLEKSARHGIHIDTLRATGGGASSPIWLQLKADIFHALSGVKSITPLKTDEAGAAGCAMMSSVALGKYKSLTEAAENFVKLGETVYPDETFADIYREKYERYKHLRSAALYAFC